MTTEADTVGSAVDGMLAAYAELGLLAEDVEDEWTYVTDLVLAWRSRLEAIAAARPDEPLSTETATAIRRLIEELGRISDPHRAIDWLSTAPQVVVLALGERP